ncbi:MAG: T9SS type A sorting domain-containing protein [Ignavibacteriaceae bacterium]|nr:T9SS type A sorting domain-containing protein [Ignavibacteriaceae bacterium]
MSFHFPQTTPTRLILSTLISYRLPVIGFVTLKVYDVLGREVATLVNEEKPAGEYEIEFDGSNLPSGVYLYRLTAGDPSTSSGQKFSETKKLVLLK